MAPHNVLVIDDEKNLGELFTDILGREGQSVQAVTSGAAGLEALDAAPQDFGVVFLDMGLPDMTGLEVLKEIKRRQPQTPVVMITGNATKDNAVEAMRQGAYDYLAKPFNVADVTMIAARALERNRLIDENRYLRDEIRSRYNFDNVVGTSEDIQAAYVLAAKVAAQNATVLITGESGTGKEMLARTIHYQSKRGDKPFVKVNCAALPEHLLEDELFGHEKGAFTDAHTQRIGRFEWAHTGTLFLDEIGEISPSVQVKLLRVLQEREFERIGSSKTIKVDVRIIAATNKNLQNAIAEGTFRDDLFYRLNVVPIELPPLRERPEDIPELALHFVRKYCLEVGREILTIEPAAMQALQKSEWKGNIRELENCIERAVILAEDDVIEARHLLLSLDFKNIQLAQAFAVSRDEAVGQRLLRRQTDRERLPTMREAEAELIARALARTEGDEAEAATLLGIDLKTLRAKQDDTASGKTGSNGNSPETPAPKKSAARKA